MRCLSYRSSGVPSPWEPTGKWLPALSLKGRCEPTKIGAREFSRYVGPRKTDKNRGPSGEPVRLRQLSEISNTSP
jgi:hypothetical protein